MSFIKIGNEFPRKVISLGSDFLVVLMEVKKYCNIKIFKIKEGNKNQINNSIENEINNEKSDDSNCGDVPPIGSCGLFLKKDIDEDTSFELIKNNINESRRLFISIHPIIKNKENEIEEEDHLYEFIATANGYFDYTKSKLVFLV